MSAGTKIIESLKEAVRGDFARIVVDGVAWVRQAAVQHEPLYALARAIAGPNWERLENNPNSQHEYVSDAHGVIRGLASMGFVIAPAPTGDVGDMVKRLNSFGACEPGCNGRCEWCPNDIARQAAEMLVSLNSRLADAVEAERERCAKIAETLDPSHPLWGGAAVGWENSGNVRLEKHIDLAPSRRQFGRTIAAAIRAALTGAGEEGECR